MAKQLKKRAATYDHQREAINKKRSGKGQTTWDPEDQMKESEF